MKFSMILAPICGLALFSTSAVAQYDGGGPGNRGEWVTIGKKKVNSRVDRDHLRVRGSERYKKIRVCAVNRPIELLGISVVFHNGERQDIPVSTVVRGGDCTAPFDLQGRRRNMDEIYLSFAKLRPGGEPRVDIQAR